jgi:DMSO/TMAO reductase YedYZ molybdopterin-dependent catalytic subunit
MNERRFAKVSRRELLKVVPVLALGAFAIPSFQESLLKKGLGFSDWASERLFRRGHLAPTFADGEVTPFEKFPINGYDVDDPGVDFANWLLTVSGAVKKPGEPVVAISVAEVPHNTACVLEGWM